MSRSLTGKRTRAKAPVSNDLLKLNALILEKVSL